MESRPDGLSRRVLSGGSGSMVHGMLADQLGRRIAFVRLLQNGPRAGSSRLLSWFGHVGECPQISYAGTRAIAAMLRDHHCVLVFGDAHAGAWFARRTRSVLAIEHDPVRFARWRRRRHGPANADCRLGTGPNRYLAIPPDRRFDLVVIAGTHRLACARLAVARRTGGGAIYLDDAGAPADAMRGDVPAARRVLLDHARDAGLQVREFTDFAPARLRVTRGLMIG